MRVSVQAADDILVVDGKALQADCAALRKLRISAVQWYGDHGEIEFERHHKANQIIQNMEALQELVDQAKPIPSPKPPTPQELDEMHNRFMLEHPDAFKAWEERDAEVKRRMDRAMQDQAWEERDAEFRRRAMQDQQPLLVAPKPEVKPKQESAKAKPKKK